MANSSVGIKKRRTFVATCKVKMGLIRSLKWQLAMLSGNDALLKKKRLQAKRKRVAKTKVEEQLEREYYYNFVDRSFRMKMRLYLTKREIDALALTFDRFAVDFEKERMTKLEFVQMCLLAGGATEQRDIELEKSCIEAISMVFEHGKTYQRGSLVIPGKQHPYLAERVKRTWKYKVKVLMEMLKEKGNLQPPKPEPTEEERELVAKEEKEESTIDLHEFLLIFSYWNKIGSFYNDVELDPVNFFFFLFDASGKKHWTEGEFAEAMRLLLQGVYTSQYEDAVEIPSDCNPMERTAEELEEEKFLSYKDDMFDNSFRKRENKRKNLIDRYLDVVFDDIDKAEMGYLDIEDVEEWLAENGECGVEFVNETGESTLETAFQSVGAREGKMEREQFYAFVENSHLFSKNMGAHLELKLFELSQEIAAEEFKIGENNKTYITLEEFRAYLRNALDKRIANMVVRVGYAVIMKTDIIPVQGRDILLSVLRFQKEKPKFQIKNASVVKSKELHSQSLHTLRKAFLSLSPLEQLRITPFPDNYQDSAPSILD